MPAPAAPVMMQGEVEVEHMIQDKAFAGLRHEERWLREHLSAAHAASARHVQAGSDLRYGL